MITEAAILSQQKNSVIPDFELTYDLNLYLRLRKPTFSHLMHKVCEGLHKFYSV